MITRSVLLNAGILLLACATATATEGQQVTVRYTVDPVSGSILQSRAIHVFLRTTAVDLVVTNITLEPGEELRAARPDLDEVAACFENVTKPTEHDEIHIEANKDTELVFRWPPKAFWSPLGEWNLMSFEPGKQVATLHHVEEPPVSGEGLQCPDAIEVNFTAPRLSVILGGAAGALALVVLRFIYRLWRSKLIVSWPAEIREVLVGVCAGGLIAGILTFLGDLVTEKQFGVQIAATSWKGGFIIGLFAYKLGDLLAQRLWDEPAAPDHKSS